MKFVRQIICFSILALLGAILSCSSNPLSEGGTNTGNAKVVGELYTSSGQPAKDAIVALVPVSFSPSALNSLNPEYQTSVDKNGVYLFDDLPRGFYGVFGKNDTGLSYMDSVFVYGNGDKTWIPQDTLKAPGYLSGVIHLRQNGDARSVLVLVLGSMYFTTPQDSIGSFTMGPLAPGKYKVRILPTVGSYRVLDTTLTIFSAQHDTLKDTIRVQFNGIPTPTGLKAEYDSLQSIATLRWAQTDTDLIKGYNIYRKTKNGIYDNTPIARMVTDTLWQDSFGLADSTFEYKITAIDNGDNEGIKSAPTQITFSTYHYAETFKLGDSTYRFKTLAFDSKGRILATRCFVNPADFPIIVGDTSGRIFATLRQKVSTLQLISDSLFIACEKNDSLTRIFCASSVNGIERWSRTVPTYNGDSAALAIDEIGNLYVMGRSYVSGQMMTTFNSDGSAKRMFVWERKQSLLIGATGGELYSIGNGMILSGKEIIDTSGGVVSTRPDPEGVGTSLLVGYLPKSHILIYRILRGKDPFTGQYLWTGLAFVTLNGKVAFRMPCAKFDACGTEYTGFCEDSKGAVWCLKNNRITALKIKPVNEF